MKHLKDFDTHSQYEEFIGGNTKILPNVSYCEDNDEMHYNKESENKVVAVFNVRTAGETTRLFNSASVLSEMEIDGVVQETIPLTYNFGKAGRHVVKYTFNDPTTLSSFSNTDFEKISIPSSFTTIYSSCFLGCVYLTDIVLPNTLLSIGNYAFSTCTSLDSVTVNALTPPTLGSGVFVSGKAGRKIYVRSSSVDLYKNAPNWSEYASAIEEKPVS